MIVAVILSAGESSRMRRPKALLPIDGETFIERIVGALKRAENEDYYDRNTSFTPFTLKV